MQTVLVVEDWPGLRRRLDSALRDAGYFTILTTMAQEALGVVRSVHVDLVRAREGLEDVEGSTLARILRRGGFEELFVVLQAESAETMQRVADSGVADAVVLRTAEVGPVVRLVRRLLRPELLYAPGTVSFAPTLGRA